MLKRSFSECGNCSIPQESDLNDQPKGFWIVLLVAVAGMLHVVPIPNGAPGSLSRPSPQIRQAASPNQSATECTAKQLLRLQIPLT